MEKQDWRDRLRVCIEGIDILEKCKFETVENFNQFCEFIAEPAFETLAEELKKYGIKARYGFLRGRSISLRFYFPKSNGENFQYSIYLPKNSVELKLRLYIRGRKTMKGHWDEKDESFIEKVPADKVIKMAKEDLIEDIIEHYKNFAYAALTSPD